MIELRWSPRNGVMAVLACFRKAERRVTWIVGRVVILLVTADAIRRSPLKISSDVALSAFQGGMRAG